MVYKYRITLAGIKGFFRLYHLNADNTLYNFHKHIRTELEFPMDQPILFKALDAQGEVVARYALTDLGFGTVDNVTIADTIKAGAVSFVYFYDVKAKKSVIISLEGEASGAVVNPKLMESKGPVPQEFENGYVAFEDLPIEKRRLPGEDEDEDFDDDDEDFEDEDEDDEEEEIIYAAEE